MWSHMSPIPSSTVSESRSGSAMLGNCFQQQTMRDAELLNLETARTNYLVLCLSSPNHDALVERVGWVKSRFRGLLLHLCLLQLEVTQGFCDPSPTEYVDNEKTEPNVVFY